MKFDRDLWRRARPLFDELVDLDGAERHSRLERVGVEDPLLREAVERLLIADVDAEEKLRDCSFGSADGTPEIDRSSRDPLGIIGKTVSHFDVKEYLAAGGMGVVYTAEDRQLGRVVALKFPLPHQQLDESVKERFINEARSAGALDHPNLCAVFEIAESEHGLFLVMPLYAGETLKERIARDGVLKPDEALAIVQQILMGLASAHAAGVVHRDLKPGNVMLLPDGTVKVLDFGLAKIRDVSLTRSRMTLGTIGYVSPEQIRGVGVDARTDLWSIGVMLYEMLTGSLPFRGEHEIAVVHGILHREAARLSELNRDLSGRLDDLIAALLQKDAGDRYPSAETLLTDIASLRSGGALVHRAPFWGRGARRRRVRDIARPHWRRSLIAAATVVAITGGAVWQHETASATVPPIAIAVLPFSGDSAWSSIALGLSDAIATDLSKLSGATSPSYLATSVYRTTSRSVPQIAREQRVRAVLRGSMAHVAEGTRVDAELVDGVSGELLWKHRYNLPPTGLAQLERELMRETVGTLGIRLTSAERDSLARPTTAVARAYETYLRGRAVELAGQPFGPRELPLQAEAIRAAQSLYSKARDLDPTFALARGRLALMHALAATTYDPTPARREQARAEAESALRLQPTLAEAHEALGSYRSLSGNLPTAIGEVGLAVRSFPHSAHLRLARATLFRQAERLEESAAECDTAMQLEPGNPQAAFQAGVVNSNLRRFAAAVRAYSHVLAVAPDAHLVKVIKGQAYLRWTGNADTLAELMRTVPADWDGDGYATHARFTALSVQHRYADALVMLDHSKSVLSHDPYLYQPTVLMRAQVLEALGERTAAHESYGKARAFLQDSVAAHPGDAHIRVVLAFALAGLGQKAEALREERRAVELVAASKDVLTKGGVMGVAVEVLAKVGETDRALDLLELLLSMHAGREATAPYIRVWPGFDPLRRDPRFEALMVRFAADSARQTTTAARRQ